MQVLTARLNAIGPLWGHLLPYARNARRHVRPKPDRFFPRRGVGEFSPGNRPFEVMSRRLWHDIGYEGYHIEVIPFMQAPTLRIFKCNFSETKFQTFTKFNIRAGHVEWLDCSLSQM